MRWVAAPLAIFVTGRPGALVPTWLALSGAACWIERFGQESVVIRATPEEEEGGKARGMLRSETIGAARRVAAAGVDAT